MYALIFIFFNLTFIKLTWHQTFSFLSKYMFIFGNSSMMERVYLKDKEPNSKFSAKYPHRLGFYFLPSVPSGLYVPRKVPVLMGLKPIP